MDGGPVLTDGLSFLREQPEKERVRRELSIEFAMSRLRVPLGGDGWALCPFHDDHRPSMHLFVGDDGVERWHCFPCGRGGDVYDLIAGVERCGFAGAFARAVQMLGQRPAGWERTVDLELGDSGVTPEDWRADVEAMQAWARAEPALLAERGEGIPPDALLGAGVGLSGEGALVFPYVDQHGILSGCKVRFPDGSKVSLKGSRFPLYLSCRPRTGPVALVCEGELDTLWAVAQGLPGLDVYGLPGGSLRPEAATSASLIARPGTVYFATDGDEAGDRAYERWSRWLASHPTRAGVLRLPIPRGEDLRSCGLDLRGLISGSG